MAREQERYRLGHQGTQEVSKQTLAENLSTNDSIVRRSDSISTVGDNLGAILKHEGRRYKKHKNE